MARLIHLLLIVFAFAGMAAQPAAFAAVPVGAQASMDMAVADECDEMGKDGAPCTQMTADCAVNMRCAVPSVVILDRGSFATSVVQTMPATWLSARPLAGRTLLPELHPPHA